MSKNKTLNVTQFPDIFLLNSKLFNTSEGKFIFSMVESSFNEFILNYYTNGFYKEETVIFSNKLTGALVSFTMNSNDDYITIYFISGNELKYITSQFVTKSLSKLEDTLKTAIVNLLEPQDGNN